ncbi:LapA family protein [Marinilabilia sp.]|jgi:uncharacterized integral membrane protein
MKRNQTFSFWGFIITALILVFFSVQNAQEVGFRFFIWKSYLPLSVLLIVAFLLGLIVGAIFLFRSNRREKKAEKNRDFLTKNNEKEKTPDDKKESKNFNADFPEKLE